VAVLGALIAPWLFWAGRALGDAWHIPLLVSTDFKRYFERSVLLSAFLLILPALRWLGGFTRRELGLARDPRRGFHLVGGFFLASALVLAYGLLNVHLRLSHWKESFPWNRLPEVVFTGLAVAIVEEALFRGGLLGLLRKKSSAIASAIVVSVIYAGVHFFRPDPGDLGPVHWYSGFIALTGSFGQFSDVASAVGLLTTLFLLGLMLAHARLTTHSLWLPIGLHAGLVAAKMTFNKFTIHDRNLLPWFGPDLIGGASSALFLAGCWFLVWLLFLRETLAQRDLEYSR
jgi:membrane protease YdiL (CAAX protease family)